MVSKNWKLTQSKTCMIMAKTPSFFIVGTSNPIVSEYHSSVGMHGVKFNFSSSPSLLATLPSEEFPALTDSTLVFLPMIDCWVALDVLMKREWLSRRDSRAASALSETFLVQLKKTYQIFYLIKVRKWSMLVREFIIVRFLTFLR